MTRTIRLRMNHARVQITNEQLRAIAAPSSDIDYLLNENAQPEGMPILLRTGAKAYCRAGGWWDIMGYAYDGSDVERALILLEQRL